MKRENANDKKEQYVYSADLSFAYFLFFLF